MTKEDLKKMLQEAHKEELAEHDKYCDWSKELMALGHDKCAAIIKDIAHEEQTHAMFIAHIIEKL